MENNKREDKYYRVYLNGPNKMFDTYNWGYETKFNKSSFKFKVLEQKFRKEKKVEYGFWRNKEYEVDVPYMVEKDESVYIYCREVDGKMIDIITNDEYSFAKEEDSDKYKQLTYFEKSEESKDWVLFQLRKMNIDLIRSYVNRINELKAYAQRNYISPEERIRIEKQKIEKDADERDFIANFHKNYGSSNTKTRKK